MQKEKEKKKEKKKFQQNNGPEARAARCGQVSTNVQQREKTKGASLITLHTKRELPYLLLHI